ncbi:hypothetical protein DTO96_100239 [Ephemeroptericola cinctiostellae]|uniref:O-methyltransferase n=1 Tax=Ephemeroptericola cinctiostellae TaxID=2268024 RepID=A0A345D842_9BURK|nr:class I SAM-dependent methyltransferase [Ephemeroptericola cinctiostellae]AXF84530.1 hypothetical protein DTO96_100239 [Ephemeroptericola cinctiostellae]
MIDLSLLALGTAPIDPKRTLTLSEAINELPNLTPHNISDATLSAYLNALYAQGRERHTPNISPINTIFLQRLLVQRHPKRILEVGCANGYSTLRFWQTTRPWQAQITTLEVSAPNITEAQHHFSATGAHNDITLHEGNALELMPQLPLHSFDFIFIDARKIYTLDFFIRARQLATPNALIVIDDVIKFKDKMLNFYDYLKAESIDHTIERIDDDEDGVMLIYT